MGIQIDEKLLSEDVKKVLHNVKNKSQFLRDALEFYVKNMNTVNNSSGECNLNKDLIEDIKDIKSMLLEISKGSNVNTIESPSINYKETITKEGKPIEENIIKEESTKVEVKSAKEQNTKAEVSVINELDNIKDNGSDDKSELKNNEMTDEQKREIEEMINNSLNLFI